jgi:hypothetical protein
MNRAQERPSWETLSDLTALARGYISPPSMNLWATVQ